MADLKGDRLRVGEVEIQSMGREELLALHDRLSDEASRMKTQIANAKADVLARGEHSDPDWWSRVNTALRITGRTLQKIQARLGQLRKVQRDANRAAMAEPIVDEHLAFLHRFFRIAKKALTAEEYDSICTQSQSSDGDVTCSSCAARLGKMDTL